MKVLVIGGDRRMLFAANTFREKGYSVDTYGLISGERGDINAADIIVLPVPVSRDKVNINCALTGEVIPLDTLNYLPEKTFAFGGGKLKIKNYTDYLALDDYKIKNAAVTAEGAIAYAIDNTDFSLWQSRILVIGYGKTGRAITERLKGFSPLLSVSARNPRDFADLQFQGINSINTADIHKHRGKFSIVFNTVDIKFSESVANALRGTLFLDISTFGGFEYGEAEKHGIEYKKLPGLPGVCAPRSAGKIIAETVINLQNTNGEKYA